MNGDSPRFSRDVFMLIKLAGLRIDDSADEDANEVSHHLHAWGSLISLEARLHREAGLTIIIRLITHSMLDVQCPSHHFRERVRNAHPSLKATSPTLRWICDHQERSSSPQKQAKLSRARRVLLEYYSILDRHRSAP